MQDDPSMDAPPVTLLGDGPVWPGDIARAHALAPTIIAADGGARHALAEDLPVDRIVGDLDSLTNLEVWHNSGTEVTQIDDQNSTDFEKCLRTVSAPFYIGVGFLGRRLDHSLACLSALLAHRTQAVVLVGETDLVFHCPRRFDLDAAPGTRVSLFPMAPVTGRTSTGLRWPINGLDFVPGGQIGTSNETTGPRFSLDMAGAGMLVLLPKSLLAPVIQRLAD